MKADFYILAARNVMQAWQFACQLIEQRYQHHESIYVAMNSPDEANRMDNLLWTFKDISFIPHALYEVDPEAPVVIGAHHNDTSLNFAFDNFINLSHQIPTGFNHCKNLIEIVFDNAHMQQLARERFRHYRDSGITLNTIKT